MSWWQLGAAATSVIAVAYLAIAAFIFAGLRRTGQLLSNPLAFMTGVIFVSCGVGHALHGYHLIVPSDAMGMGMGGGMRDMWSAELAVWDGLTACVAVTYLALRRRYGQLLHTPRMFEDAVERAAAVELRGVLEQLREGVLVVGRDGGVEQLNDGARELLGRYGLDGAAMAAGESAGAAAVQRTRRTGEPTDDVEVVVADGERSGVLRLSVRALDAAGPGPHRVVVSFTDVTARRRGEEELRASAERTEAILDGLTEGVVFYDADLVVRGINGAGERMLGSSGGALVGLPAADAPLEVLDADGRSLPVEGWPSVRAGRTGRPQTDVVIGMRTPGAPTRWVQVNASPLSGEQVEGPWPVVASFTDITERRRRERALAEAEQRVRATFDAAPIGIRVAALDGTYLEVNTAFAELLGRTVEDLVGRNRVEVTHPEDLAAQLGHERRLLAGEVPSFRMEQRFLHAAGHVVWTQLDVTALRDADGAPISTVGQIQDISERRRHDAQLRHLADHDALTGLLNRRGFQRELERHVDQGRRYGAAGALLMLDLDHFKYVNDTLGHQAGDELIVAVADLLRGRMRKTDVIARLGGDEFAVLLPRGTREQARGAADSVLRALRGRTGDVPALGRLRLTASVGIATLEDPTLTADELLVNADLAMYDAKEAGRDRAADYATGPHREPRIRARITWVERIDAALAQGGFELFAQPIRSLGQDRVVMHELLLRMRGEGGDLVPPAAFLSVAERFELVQDIDRWVIDQACGMLAAQATAGTPVVLSVNVSGKSLDDPDALLTHVAAALERAGAPPEGLVVEITEGVAVGQAHHARTVARDLRRLGCRVAVDDFGSGVGSFAFLKQLPFDLLKIDGDLVSQARHSRPEAVMVAALRDMAEGLGREVVAEWCADAETLEHLRAAGIDLVQGFHTGRPVPVEAALAPAG